jgi:hypothetical protein
MFSANSPKLYLQNPPYILSYSESLALHGLDLLEWRRFRFDLVYYYYYKVFNHLTPFDPSEVFNIYSPLASSRSETPYLLKPIHATNRLLLSLFFQSVVAWNALPAALGSLTFLLSAKHSL